MFLRKYLCMHVALMYYIKSLCPRAQTIITEEHPATLWWHAEVFLGFVMVTCKQFYEP